MLNALEKVMYPNGTTRALGDITSGSVSSIIDEVHANTSAISDINTKLGHLTYDSETEKYNMSSGLNVRWHLVAQHHLRANDFDLGENNAGFRNSIYRGKNLGTSVTAEQWDAIEAGTFENLFIGDYWTINGVKWRIAGFDYFLNKGPTEAVTSDHHVIIVPDTCLLKGGQNKSYMQETASATGAYKDSGYHSGTNLDSSPNTSRADCITIINSAFGNGKILTHKELITTAVTNEKASNWTWDDCTVECMSEVMAYGTPAWGDVAYEVASSNTQLPLFGLCPTLCVSDQTWWLRSVSGSSSFATYNVGGYTSYSTANNSDVGIRPYFAIYNPTTQQNSTRKKTSKKKGD